jgi:predicted Zn-dependent peptidase
MKNTSIFKTMLLSFLFFTGCQTTGVKSSLNKKKLLNGVELLNFKDEKYPNFHLLVWSEEGSATESANKSGVTSILGKYLKEGTLNKGKKDLLESLSNIGANVRTISSKEQFLVSSKPLVEDSEKLIKIVSEMILKPSFYAPAFKDLKSKQLGYIKQVNDDPASLLDKLFTKQLFQNHPYSRSSSGSVKTIKDLQLSQVKDRYQSVFDPSKLKIALIGNWTPEAERLIISEFSEIEKKTLSKSSQMVSVQEKAKENTFYTKRGLSQAQVKMGFTTVESTSPDIMPLGLGLKVLGGSFKSLLNEELRVKRGLTYGIGAGLRIHEKGSLIVVSSSVRHDKLVELVEVTQKVISDFVKRGVTEVELEKMKALIAGEYPRSVETLEQEASAYLGYESMGLEGRDVYSYLSRVNKVTKDQVDGALRRRLDINKMNLVILGDHRKVRDLKKLQVKVKRP